MDYVRPMRGIRRVAPSVVTLAGLMLAFWSMVLTAEGRFEAAAWVVFAAAICDIADGTVARGLGVISPFGQQLDSLADLVAAGVAPAFLVHQVHFESWGFGGTLIAGAWVVFVAARLARFNTSPAPSSRFFVGVPCPIAATFLVHYMLFSRATFDSDGEPWIAAALIVVLGALMLSTVPYWKSSTVLPGNFRSYPYGPGVVATALGCIAFPRQSLFVWIGASLVVAVVLDRMGRNRQVVLAGEADVNRTGPLAAS